LTNQMFKIALSSAIAVVTSALQLSAEFAAE
jgi:hypothetical protein